MSIADKEEKETGEAGATPTAAASEWTVGLILFTP